MKGKQLTKRHTNLTVTTVLSNDASLVRLVCNFKNENEKKKNDISPRILIQNANHAVTKNS